MKTGKLTALFAAGALAAAPMPVLAQSAAPLSVAQSVHSMGGETSELRGSRSASIAIGLTILVAILAIALSGGDGPSSP